MHSADGGRARASERGRGNKEEIEKGAREIERKRKEKNQNQSINSIPQRGRIDRALMSARAPATPSSVAGQTRSPWQAARLPSPNSKLCAAREQGCSMSPVAARVVWERERDLWNGCRVSVSLFARAPDRGPLRKGIESVGWEYGAGWFLAASSHTQTYTHALSVSPSLSLSLSLSLSVRVCVSSLVYCAGC